MFSSLTRACLLVFIATFSASVRSDEPPSIPGNDKQSLLKKLGIKVDSYTAFPDLKAPTRERKEVKLPDGNIAIEYEEKDPIRLPEIPKPGANDSPLRKVQFEQVQEGLAYIKWVEETIRIGSWNESFFQEFIKMAVEVYRVAAELEEKLAKRVPWYEARVRKLKDLEKFILTRVELGSSPPQNLHSARFARLQAEADLLKLKAEVEKAK